MSGSARGRERTSAWLRSCGTVGKPDGNREDKHQPETLGETGLLTEVMWQEAKTFREMNFFIYFSFTLDQASDR